MCASNRDLASAVAAGTFREDLFHRVNIVTLQVPPLRERREDIPELVQALVQRANHEVGKAITSVEQAVLDNLKARDWPGNVRELEHVISRALLVARGPVLTIHDLGFDPEGAAPADNGGSSLDGLLGRSRRRLLGWWVRRFAVASTSPSIDWPSTGWRRRSFGCVAATEGNQVAAARLLGISRSIAIKLT